MNYKEILISTLQNGVPKQPTRIDSTGRPILVENSTIGIFGAVFEHDMAQGFPLSGLRALPFKSTCAELEMFIKGVTSKKWLQERGSKYWDHWCAPYEADYIQQQYPDMDLKQVKRIGDDLGPLGYSYEWRDFGGWNSERQGFDQLTHTIEVLKKSPHDRRLVVSFWNPNSMHDAALPSCHLLHNIVVYGDTLNLWWHQRSCDLLANQSIVTYALLLLLYCKESGLKPGILKGVFADCHIYENQMQAAHEMVERSEPPLPQVEILSKTDGTFSMLDWECTDVHLRGYNPHPKIDIGSITV